MGGSHASASTVQKNYSLEIATTNTTNDTTNISTTDNSKVANALAQCMGPDATKTFNDKVEQYNITTQNVIVSGSGNRVTGNTLNINNIFGPAEAISIDECMIEQDPSFAETGGNITAAVTGGSAEGSDTDQTSSSKQTASASGSSCSGLVCGSGAGSGTGGIIMIIAIGVVLLLIFTLVIPKLFNSNKSSQSTSDNNQ